MSFSKYTDKNAEEVFKILKSSASGLSKKEALLRQKKHGLNEIKLKSISALRVFVRQLKSPFTYLLFTAAVISFFVGQKTDFFVISTAVAINIVISFFQEYRAERAIFFLRKYISKLKSEKFPKQKQSRTPISNERVGSLFRFKEERIKSYSNMLKEKDFQISALKQQIMDVGNVIMDSKNYCILKKIRNLGYLEYEHKKITLKIEDGDILLVDDPNIISRRTLEEIKDKISKIVCEKPMSRKTEDILSAAVISADRLQIHDFGQFAAVRKEALDREIDKK